VAKSTTAPQYSVVTVAMTVETKVAISSIDDQGIKETVIGDDGARYINTDVTEGDQHSR